MRLKELAAQSQTSVASIKYYLREGLLPPGRAINARLAEYDERHLERLRLIGALRGIVGASVEQIATLLRRVDDPTVSLYEVLGAAQALALGPVDVDPDAATADGPQTEAIGSLLARRGWNDGGEVPRAALAAHVAAMQHLGMHVSPGVLEAYADAADTVAEVDLRNVAEAGSRDEAVLITAVGVHSHGRLLLRLVAVAQAAHAGRADRPDPTGAPGAPGSARRAGG